MGKLTPTSDDVFEQMLTAPLANVGDRTPAFNFTGSANIAVALAEGASATVVIDKSFDGGATWLPSTNLGAVVTLTGPCTEPIFSREANVLHSARRTGGSGAGVTVRFSQ